MTIQTEAWEIAQRISLCETKFTRAKLKGGGWRCRCRRCNHKIDVDRLNDLPIECPKVNKLHPKPPVGVTQLSFELKGTANDH
jgi:hypothetical protein